MRAGELRHYGEVQKLDGTDYAKGYFSIETNSEGDGQKSYSMVTRWTPALAYLEGVSVLNEGYQVVVRLGGELHELAIRSAMDPDNRRERIALLCTEKES